MKKIYKLFLHDWKGHCDSSPIKGCQGRVDLNEQASPFSTGHFFVLVSHPNLSLGMNGEPNFKLN